MSNVSMFTNYLRLWIATRHLYGLIKPVQTSLFPIPERVGLSYLSVRLKLLSTLMRDLDSRTVRNSSEAKALLLKASAELLLVLRICVGELEKLQTSLRDEQENS